MNLRFFILILVIGYSSASFSQKGNMEEQLKKDALTDVRSLSTADYPYIDKFHQAIREELADNDLAAVKLLNECLLTRSNDDAIYFLLAKISEKEGNTKQALQYYQKAYDLDSKNIFYLQKLAECNYNLGDFNAAEPLFKELCKRNPRNPDLQFGYSKVLIYNKSYKKAIQQLNDLQEQTGVVPDLKLMETDLYVELKEYDKAEALLLKLKNEFPNDSKVLKAIVRFYKKRGEKDKAFQALEELLKTDPNNGMAQYILASNYLEQGENDKFLSLAPKLFKNKNVTVKNKLYILEAYKKLKNPSDPIIAKTIAQLYNAHPDNASIAIDYAKVLEVQHKSREAIKIYRNAVSQNKDNFNLWSLTLSIEDRYMDYSALYQDGKSAVALFPSMPFVYYEAAEGALYSGHVEEARTFLSSGEIYILDNKPLQAKFTMRKGEIEFYTKNYKKGIVAFEKAISLSDDPEIKIVYALQLAKANIASDITTKLLQKLDENQQNRDFYIASALLLSNQKNSQTAINLLEKGILKINNNAELYDLLGDLYIKDEKTVKAVEAWEKAQQLESRNIVLEKKIKDKKYYAADYQ